MVFGRQGRGTGGSAESPESKGKKAQPRVVGGRQDCLGAAENTSHRTEDLEHQFEEIELDSRVAKMWP